MKCRTHSGLIVLAAAVASLTSASLSGAESRRPNVVLILTDNQGAWTLGCYGNPEIRTPNIDRLAAEGMRFTRCFSPNAVCSPTRATLLTGLIPSQHGVHCFLGAGEAQIGPDAYCTIAEFRTLPKILAEPGYTCGLSGKWHLGDNLPPQEGFTSWITMPHGATSHLLRRPGDRRRPGTQGADVPDRFLDRARRQVPRAEQRPAVLPVPGLQRALRPGRQLAEDRRATATRTITPTSSSFRSRGADAPLAVQQQGLPQQHQAMRRYAAEVSGVDDGVGRILEALERLSLDDDTLVIFTADQGWPAVQNGLWGMGDHTRPLTAFDGTMHVPLIYRLPGRIPAGRRNDAW